MRVLHFCKTFSLLTETFIYDYVSELECQGVENHVLTTKHVNAKSRPFDKVTVVPRPDRWHWRRLWHRFWAEFGIRPVRASSWPILRPKLEQAVGRIQPDVIHAHFGPMGVLMAPIAETFGIPLVVSFHGYDAFQLPGEDLWRKEFGSLFRKARATTVVSNMMRDHLVRVGGIPERIHLVRVGKKLQDYPFRDPSEQKLQKWVSVGRMKRKKGHLDCLQAFEQVVEEFPRLSLQIVGDGEVMPEVKDYIKLNSLSSKVSLLGALPHEEVKRIMASSDAFILCSKTASSGDREGVPTVLMEAQAMGLPCVSTRHSGIPEVIPEENHFLLAEEGNVGDIAARIHELANASPSEIYKIVSRGRAKIEKEFSLQSEVGKLKALYREVA